MAEAELENAQIAAVALGVARAQHVEELGHHVAVAQPVEREPAVGQRRFLAERDDGFRHPPQLLRLRQRGLDDLVTQQRVGHVPQHGGAMAAGAVELPQS